MTVLKSLITALVLHTVNCQNNTFPHGFKLGVATAAYQIEGGWDADGKSESVWDRLTHTHPELIANQSTGDVACDSYHLFMEDVENLKNLGVNHYRFSLSWTRILPEGFATTINQKGVDYYNNLINALLDNGIEPMVTLYHWDLPQSLQELGGWMNAQMAVYFENYARVVFENFGDRVKSWITINEPKEICAGIYEYDGSAPSGLKSPGIGLYLCTKTVLLAHARTYRLYNTTFREQQGGRVGITLDTDWFEPKTNSSEDTEATDREIQMQLGWWAHPIFSEEGDYPAIMRQRVDEISKKEHFLESRLPPLTADEIEFIRGTADFFGLNNYNTFQIANKEFADNAPHSFQKDRGTETSQNPDWKPAPNIVPWGLRRLLNWVKDQYNNPPVIVTENGFGGEDGVEDAQRVLYLKEFMKAILSAVYEDGCNVEGYTVWSLMDNMEWRSGYTVKFGLYQVDFSSPNRTRTPKSSADFYKNITKTRTIPDN